MSESVTKGINTVYLPVSDPHKSALWYEKNLGLRILRPVGEGATQAQIGFPNGQALFLIKTKSKGNANFIEFDGHEQCPVTFEVSNIEHLYSTLSEQGAEMEELEDNEDCGKNFYLYDPDGNKLDIWSGWPIKITINN
ncbi:hypothetical protein GCM10008967_24560 [Bacillus carboniphilus]|uniref:VOC domain-containing protein n=1 Tax=Bacillus carboniphilus TaxID=86663 RepID=A0ABN0WCV7_9BACI